MYYDAKMYNAPLSTRSVLHSCSFDYLHIWPVINMLVSDANVKTLWHQNL